MQPMVGFQGTRPECLAAAAEAAALAIEKRDETTKEGIS